MVSITGRFKLMAVLAMMVAILAGCNLPTGTPPPTATLEPTPGPYSVSQPGPGPACSVAQRPELSIYSQNIHADPDDTSTVLGFLPVGNWVAVTQRINGWYQVSLPGAPVDGGWINRGSVLLAQDCSCYPRCAEFEPQGPVNAITTCMLTLPAGTTFTIYYQPDTTSDVFATISDGVTAQAVARTGPPDRWIGFDPGVAQADNIGMDRLRWVLPEPEMIVLGGPACDALPMYDYLPVE